MNNIIPFYAYPRSGATLFSTLLNNHPDFIVTPEMYDVHIPTTGKKDWAKFIDFLNNKFLIEFDSQSTLEDINSYLDKENKYLFYRVWLWGRFKREPNFAQKEFSAEKQMFLIRNFFHSLGSEGKFTNKDWNNYVKYSVEHYKSMLDMIEVKRDIIVHYEELLNKPLEEYNKILNILNMQAITNYDILNINTQKKHYVSGDYKIKNTNKILKGSKYYKYQFNSKLRKNVKLELGSYKVQKYINLKNPSIPKTIFGFITMQIHILAKRFLIRIGLFNFLYSIYFKLTPHKKRANYGKK